MSKHVKQMDYSPSLLGRSFKLASSSFDPLSNKSTATHQLATTSYINARYQSVPDQPTTLRDAARHSSTTVQVQDHHRGK